MSFSLKLSTIVLFFIVILSTSNVALGHTKLPFMQLNVKVDTKQHLVRGEAVTTFSALQSGKVVIGNAKILRILGGNKKDIPFEINTEEQTGEVFVTTKTGLHTHDPVKIIFETRIGTDAASKGPNIISSDFVLLMDSWCPLVKGLAIYRLTVETPKELKAVSEADEISEQIRGKTRQTTFVFDHPRRSITLVAGRFMERKVIRNGVSLCVYLFKNRPGLSKRLLGRLEEGLSLYERLLSPFPFKRFQVVENPAPTGITVPTITLIGSQIIDKPFVLDTSLIHEFVHSWFGNSVFVKKRGGNWCEGLTTYLADYLIQEKMGKAVIYRHDILSDYKSYVHGGKNGFPLSCFRFRYDRISKAIGYGKGAMVFHMLRKMVGDKTFFRDISRFSRLYRFKEASWQDIENLFKNSLSEQDSSSLDTFFDQWLQRKDVPVLKIEQCQQEEIGDEGQHVTRIVISQGNKTPYMLLIQIRVFTDKGSKDLVIEMNGSKKAVEFSTACRPRFVVLDPGFDLMRDLAPEEFPPSISRLLGAEKRFVILPKKKEYSIYEQAISFFKSSGFTPVERKKLKHSMLKKGAFLVLGSVEGRLKSFAPRIKGDGKGVVLKVGLNPLNPHQVAALLQASSAMQLRKTLRKIPHYGKYSLVRFKNGLLQEKKRDDFEKGVGCAVTPGLTGLFSKHISSLKDIIKGLNGKKVVYLGEKHDQEGIHQAQLRIIKELSKRQKIAVGMEMFQRPFQDAIDRYLQGKIDERQFLKQTEYFKRWAFNYHFYRPIIQFCKEHSIPVVSLNLKSEISKKIARKGFSRLSQKEQSALPKDLDLTNELYRRYLRKVYTSHSKGEIDDFEHFFEAQIAWDETMAESIARYISSHPERSMVVIVGEGHVEYGYGIPSRVSRRIPSIDQAIALFNEQPSDPSRADLFLFAPQMDQPFTPKLGVLLTGQNKLTVEAVIPGSPAAKAGVKKGDVITKVAGKTVKDIYDLKTELFFHKRGEQIGLEVARKDRSGRVKKLELVTGKLEPFNWNRGMIGFHPSK